MTSTVYTGGPPLTSQYTTCSHFEYTPGLDVLKEIAGWTKSTKKTFLKVGCSSYKYLSSTFGWAIGIDGFLYLNKHILLVNWWNQFSNYITGVKQIIYPLFTLFTLVVFKFYHWSLWVCQLSIINYPDSSFSEILSVGKRENYSWGYKCFPLPHPLCSGTRCLDGYGTAGSRNEGHFIWDILVKAMLLTYMENF